jgi:hypothetical protein
MSAPEIPDVVDQITTAILDIMQIEEMKVCVGVLEEQLRQVGYDIHTCNLLHTGKNDARAASRGWYYVVASRAT